MSSYVPCASIFPPFRTTILSAKWRKSTACVTRTRVLFLSRPQNTCLNIFFFTFESSAEIGSSIKQISELPQTARARLTLAFYPPDRLIPFSPISVISPAGRISKSLINQHAFSVSKYLLLLYCKPNKILSFIVLFWIHAFYSTKLSDPLIFTGASYTSKSSLKSFSLSLSKSSGVAV